MSDHSRFHGVHAATVCPLRLDFSIDEAALARHVETVARTPGVKGLLINGHAGENFLLTREELSRVVAIAREAVPKECWLTAGINAESSLEAARLARCGARRGRRPAGVSAQQLCAPSRCRHGGAPPCPCVGSLAPADHALPGAGRGWPHGLWAAHDRGFDQSDRVAAIKEGSCELATYEQNYRLVKALRPDIAVLGSGDEHLLVRYLVGSDGAQVSLAAVVPELTVALHEATSAGDFARARQIHEKIYPLARRSIARRRPLGRLCGSKCASSCAAVSTARMGARQLSWIRANGRCWSGPCRPRWVRGSLVK
jgi:4-hydroxy-tetrahydrodipicolinate synthase